MPRRKQKKEKEKQQTKTGNGENTNQKLPSQSDSKFKDILSNIKNQHDSSKFHEKIEKLHWVALLSLAATFYVNLSGYRVIHGIAIFLVGMMLLTRRSQARLASVRAKEGIKLWKSLLTSVRSDWRQRSANANGCTYSINLLKEHLSSLNISQTEANINKEIITSKNHVNQMYDEHKESEAIARKERDRERDSVAPKEFTGDTAKEFEEELKELQTQWKENAPERKAKAVRQRMHIQKRYDYDETKDELAEIGGGTLQAVIDQQRVSISKAKAALDETDSELHAAKAEERTLQDHVLKLGEQRAGIFSWLIGSADPEPEKKYQESNSELKKLNAVVQQLNDRLNSLKAELQTETEKLKDAEEKLGAIATTRANLEAQIEKIDNICRFANERMEAKDRQLHLQAVQAARDAIEEAAQKEKDHANAQNQMMAKVQIGRQHSLVRRTAWDQIWEAEHSQSITNISISAFKQAIDKLRAFQSEAHTREMKCRNDFIDSFCGKQTKNRNFLQEAAQEWITDVLDMQKQECITCCVNAEKEILEDYTEIRRLAIELDMPQYGELPKSTPQTSAEKWDPLRNDILRVVTHLQSHMEQTGKAIESLSARVEQLSREENRFRTTIKKLLSENNASYCSPQSSYW